MSVISTTSGRVWWINGRRLGPGPATARSEIVTTHYVKKGVRWIHGRVTDIIWPADPFSVILRRRGEEYTTDDGCQAGHRKLTAGRRGKNTRRFCGNCTAASPRLNDLTGRSGGKNTGMLVQFRGTDRAIPRRRISDKLRRPLLAATSPSACEARD